MVERRREQAAEEGTPGWWAWRAFPDGALSGYPRGCHSRLCGNVLLKPLDSGLRRNDEGAVVENLSRVKHGLTE